MFPPVQSGLPFPYITAPVITIQKPSLKKAPEKDLNLEPNFTIYISNLNEEVRILDLKMALETKFKKYGNILDIIAQKNLRMRGQAFVVFDTIDAAKKAVDNESFKPLFHKEMLIQYSHNRSDKIADRTGELDDNRRIRREKMVRRLEQRRLIQPIKPQTTKNTNNLNGASSNIINDNVLFKSSSDHMVINKILFLTNLPDDIEESNLIELFKQYPGFKEVRLVPSRSDIAFVEYETEMQAAMAKNTLNNYPILKDHPIKITFAKK
ncbi:small nuclear ribonucleoprotein polypeptide B [Neoconidiobolus thromboides FSU 785]|nr:small nuclear ribonucleoprotein polypeptide B [Neoconidiobolus thromboides FSU 785]